ncbi:hypothetical protein DDE01_02010 [Desulfovibrio desulfuricans]|nr:hypothetical protein DDE01_02010 [Desulfovibrio desulfuricans]
MGMGQFDEARELGEAEVVGLHTGGEVLETEIYGVGACGDGGEKGGGVARGGEDLWLAMHGGMVRGGGKGPRSGGVAPDGAPMTYKYSSRREQAQTPRHNAPADDAAPPGTAGTVEIAPCYGIDRKAPWHYILGQAIYVRAMALTAAPDATSQE